MLYREDAAFWFVEDTTGHLRRNSREPERIDLRLYRVAAGQSTLALEKSYEPGSLSGVSGQLSRAEMVMEMLESLNVQTGMVVCSHRTASPRTLAQLLQAAGLDFVLEISATTAIQFRGPGRPAHKPSAKRRLKSAEFLEIDPRAPRSDVRHFAASLGPAMFAGIEGLECFAMSTGGIATFARGMLIGVTTLAGAPLEELAHLLGWVRWIRTNVRRGERTSTPHTTAASAPNPSPEAQLALSLPVRANLQIARRLDEAAAAAQDLFKGFEPRGVLAREQRPLNVVELFAGAGGMGLGFLLAAGNGPTRFRIIHSGELHPVYSHTLRINHQYLQQHGVVECDAVPPDVTPEDLSMASAAEKIRACARDAGGVDILIGGPPCQGFSSANRNSWSSSNPNNRLVDTFLDYAGALQPRVLLMENVQGILWTRASGAGSEEPSVAVHVVKRLQKLGYGIFPKVLDAAWYGVPQHRSRFFLLALHTDLGYRPDDFSAWGPFPVPSHGPAGAKPVSVGEAILDLPPVANGDSASELPYRAPSNRSAFAAAMRDYAPEDVVWDHVVSRQADFVIDRYCRIPQGGNWENVVDLMTNYADVSRTHSNIYRRLTLDDPSITIGHYRKSMIIHPLQHRGLSLREAARLQSFPDWFRFAGTPESLEGGLTHKQQQLANAVCPLVTKAVAQAIASM